MLEKKKDLITSSEVCSISFAFNGTCWCLLTVVCYSYSRVWLCTSQKNFCDAFPPLWLAAIFYPTLYSRTCYKLSLRQISLNELHDITASLLTKVSLPTTIISGEHLKYKTSNDADETRLNVMAEKFSLVQEPTQFDV